MSNHRRFSTALLCPPSCDVDGLERFDWGEVSPLFLQSRFHITYSTDCLVYSKTFRPLFYFYLCPAVFCTFQVLTHPQRGRSPFPLSSSHVDCCYLLFWLPGVPASKKGLNLSLSSSCSTKQLAEEKKPRDYLMWMQREFAHTTGAEGMSAAVPWEAEPASTAHQGASVAPGSCFHTE